MNGNLLMYTDGAKVWDANNNLMPNGTGLLGNISKLKATLENGENVEQTGNITVVR